MVLAVTYDTETGNIGEHFGHADHFKLYEIYDGKVQDSAVVEPFGTGHDSVVYTLNEYNVTLVFCSGIGDGAIKGLKEAGIQCVPGLEGNADEKVEAFIRGEVAIPMDYASNCGSEAGGSCCDSDSCSAGCGGCCH